MAAADLLQPAPSAPAGASGSQLAEPGRRGSLSVADRAVEKIARAAVLTVPGVAPAAATSGALSGALGRDLPRVDVERAGHRLDAEVEVASLWPHAAATVAAGVRDAVVAQLSSLVGITADAVSVAVVRVVRPGEDRPERRRVQ